jgi:hypothetical protein
MSDLRGSRTNARVEAVLLSRDIFDPSDLDEMPLPPLIDFALEAYDPEPTLDPDACEGTTVGWYGPRPRMPWEVMP